MKQFREPSIIFLIGSVSYTAIELLWRRYSHWTMTLTGGVCFVILHQLFQRQSGKRLWQKCVMGAFSITGVEFAVGCIVNIWLKWDIWDYSKLPGNLLGQVCPLYTCLWSLLCIPVVGFSGFLHKALQPFIARQSHHKGLWARHTALGGEPPHTGAL